MLHIGLTQRVDCLPDRDERRDGLDQAWAEWVITAGYMPVPLPNQPEHAETLLNELRIDAIILTGGNDLVDLPDARDAAPMRDEFERRLLDIASERGLPVLGVCRGMQMMVHYYGGKLIRVDGHVRSLHPVEHCGHVMPTLPRTTVNNFHRFATRPELLPDSLTVAGLAPDGTVEAVVHKDRPQWAIMWHPERPTGTASDRFNAEDTQILQRLLKAGIRKT